ncbi:MAG: hypothetical protein PF489_01215 [Salinivirgaceae bacterium]|jgi:hypothetical protein|nr:hypothetical protein [Salinivirgaceae bacterium]
MDIFFHVGLGKTGSTYLQHKFFPFLKGIHYIHHTKYKKALDIIGAKNHERYFVSREFDRQFLDEIQKFAARYPDTHPIMVLRRQDKWIASQYRRLTKNGRGIYFNEFVNLENNNGRWDISEMEFYPKIKQLEKYFTKKPLVLLYDELRTNPTQFFDKIAHYTQTTYNADQISLRPKHKSYSEKQLLAVRYYTRKWLRHIDEQKLDSTQSGRRTRKIATHLIMYIHKLLPAKKYAAKPLIKPTELEAIQKHFEADWEKCVKYIEENAPNAGNEKS